MPTLQEMKRRSSMSPREQRMPLLSLLAAVCLVASACGSTGEGADGPQYGDSIGEFFNASGASGGGTPSQPPDGYEAIQWEDLIPPGYSGAEISARFDERIAGVEPGSPEADAVFADLQAAYDNVGVHTELSGQEILLTGFVAPLAYEGDRITEFLLVPYFGACIHVPPPPPNQIVMVTLADGEGLTIDESWGVIWVTGTITIDGADTDLATAGYSISAARTGVQSY